MIPDNEEVGELALTCLCLLVGGWEHLQKRDLRCVNCHILFSPSKIFIFSYRSVHLPTSPTDGFIDWEVCLVVVKPMSKFCLCLLLKEWIPVLGSKERSVQQDWVLLGATMVSGLKGAYSFIDPCRAYWLSGSTNRTKLFLESNRFVVFLTVLQHGCSPRKKNLWKCLHERTLQQRTNCFCVNGVSLKCM